MCISACRYRRTDEADKAWCGWGLAWGDVRARLSCSLRGRRRALRSSILRA